MLDDTAATDYDLVFDSISSAEGLMGLAAEANRRAHSAEEEGEEELRDFWFDRKLGMICLLVLTHRDLVKIRPCKGTPSVQVSGIETKLHAPKREIAAHIRNNGYEDRARLLLLQAFGIRPRKSERKLEPRPKSGPRSH